MVSPIEAVDLVLERLEARFHLPDRVEPFLVRFELERGAPRLQPGVAPAVHHQSGHGRAPQRGVEINDLWSKTIHTVSHRATLSGVVVVRACNF